MKEKHWRNLQFATDKGALAPKILNGGLKQ